MPSISNDILHDHEASGTRKEQRGEEDEYVTTGLSEAESEGWLEGEFEEEESYMEELQNVIEEEDEAGGKMSEFRSFSRYNRHLRSHHHHHSDDAIVNYNITDVDVDADMNSTAPTSVPTSMPSISARPTSIPTAAPQGPSSFPTSMPSAMPSISYAPTKATTWEGVDYYYW